MLQKTHEATAQHRRSLILDAAARCFVRTGFHRATMQDIASEAGMSPGNLYRYFRSKGAMVEGLAERDRAELAADFDAFDAGGDFMANFAAIGRKHFEDGPRDKAVLCLQIWAEATRDPAFQAIIAECEADVHGRLMALMEQARAAGDVPAGADIDAIVRMIQVLADGLFVRCAILPDFDPEREVGAVMSLICALVQGRVDLACPAEPVGTPS